MTKDGGIELDLCNPNCGTLDCYTIGCIIKSIEPCSGGKAEPCPSFSEVAVEKQNLILERQRKDSRVGFVK